MVGASKDIEYPPGAEEIPTENISNGELIRRLKVLVDCLSDLAQDEKSAQTYIPLARLLSTVKFLKNNSREIAGLAACCLAEIFRISAPDCPFPSQQKLKEVLVFMIRQLRGLDTAREGNLYPLAKHLLESFDKIKTLNVALRRLDDPHEIYCEICKHILGVIKDDEGEDTVKMVKDLCVAFMEDDCVISQKGLDLLLMNLLEPYKTQNRKIFELTKDILVTCESILESPLTNYLNQRFACEKTEKTQIGGSRLYFLIEELNPILPQIVRAIIPQLHARMINEDPKERLEVVALSGTLLNQDSTSITDEFLKLAEEFLLRMEMDVDQKIRSTCLSFTIGIINKDPALVPKIKEIIIGKTRDNAENVRFEAIRTLSSLLKSNILPVEPPIIDAITQRLRDLKFDVRREAMMCIGTLYRKVLTSEQQMSDEATKAMKDARNSLLHCYYNKNQDDKVQVQRILKTCIVPYMLTCEEKANILLETYCSMDSTSSMVFDEIFKKHALILRQLRKIIRFIRPEEDVIDESTAPTREERLARMIRHFSILFCESEELEESLTDFFDFIADDDSMYKNMQELCDENLKCSKSVEKAVKEIMARLGTIDVEEDIKKRVKQVLERSAPLILDQTTGCALIDRIADVLNEEVDASVYGGAGVTTKQLIEKSCHLVQSLSKGFPSVFSTEESVAHFFTFLRSEKSAVVQMAISTLTELGPMIRENHKHIYATLIPELRKISINGRPKEAKFAVRCLRAVDQNWEYQLEKIFEECSNHVSDINDEKLPTSMSSLTAMIPFLFGKFGEKMKSLISTIVKNIIFSNKTHTFSDLGGEWYELDEISHECFAKVLVLKFIANFIKHIPSKSYSEEVAKASKLFFTILSTGGDLRKSEEIHECERAQLRLTAGNALLKVAENKFSSEAISAECFVKMSLLVCDEYHQVASKFLNKLSKYYLTNRFVLSTEYLAVLCLSPLSALKGDHLREFCAKTSSSLAKIIEKLKSFIRNRPSIQEHSSFLMPEYSIAYAIYLLSHHPDFKSRTDLTSMRNWKNCLWIFLKPFVMEPKFNSIDMLYQLVQEVKHCVDSSAPNDDDQNKKLWSLCDLVLVLLSNRAPAKPLANPAGIRIRLTKKFFAPSDEFKEKSNKGLYIPRELVDEESRGGTKHKQVVLPIQAAPEKRAPRKEKKPTESPQAEKNPSEEREEDEESVEIPTSSSPSPPKNTRETAKGKGRKVLTPTTPNTRSSPRKKRVRSKSISSSAEENEDQTLATIRRSRRNKEPEPSPSPAKKTPPKKKPKRRRQAK